MVGCGGGLKVALPLYCRLLFTGSDLHQLLSLRSAGRATLLAVITHLHRWNMNDFRALPTFRTGSPREPSLKTGIRVRHVDSLHQPPDSCTAADCFSSDSFHALRFAARTQSLIRPSAGSAEILTAPRFCYYRKPFSVCRTGRMGLPG